MKLHLLAAASLAIGLVVPALAQEKDGPCKGPEDACRQLAEAIRDYQAAFNKKDAAAAAAFYALDAVWVTEGPILSGRDAIEQIYNEGVRTDSNLVMTVKEYRIMGDASAVAYGYWTEMSSGRPLHGNWVTLYTHTEGTWKMTVDTFNIIETK
jgi:uncharacterized protein (TIGR02246 family)